MSHKTCFLIYQLHKWLAWPNLVSSPTHFNEQVGWVGWETWLGQTQLRSLVLDFNNPMKLICTSNIKSRLPVTINWSIWFKSNYWIRWIKQHLNGKRIIWLCNWSWINTLLKHCTQKQVDLDSATPLDASAHLIFSLMSGSHTAWWGVQHYIGLATYGW